MSAPVKENMASIVTSSRLLFLYNKSNWPRINTKEARIFCPRERKWRKPQQTMKKPGSARKETKHQQGNNFLSSAMASSFCFFVLPCCFNFLDVRTRLSRATTEKFLSSFTDIANGAYYIINSCPKVRDSSQGAYVWGQVFHVDNWNVIVREDRQDC
ncbi:hypothetical protein L249_7687 [Ophiocordyceps polyrhachis-furcata BCC 54312]|uniref:Uncharacterized protein n=1 Tax=Ophiocordyceps polyrhachis-furcata BCC 54312 TaxID=1330021 RepID=A0A367LAG6_9HYPO|nr:hypothetical protein L249_7687 [Ophiocordyceps polyrhachis-furcata BCC 54312]